MEVETITVPKERRDVSIEFDGVEAVGIGT